MIHIRSPLILFRDWRVNLDLINRFRNRRRPILKAPAESSLVSMTPEEDRRDRCELLPPSTSKPVPHTFVQSTEDRTDCAAIPDLGLADDFNCDR